MRLAAAAPANAMPCAEDRDLLAASGLLDVEYRVRAGLSPSADSAAHYLTAGWLDDLAPCDGFDAAFLRPHYEAAGRVGAPAITWLELSLLPGRAPPRNEEEAAYLADRIRGHRFFDAAAYAVRLPASLDPALHYAVIGELLGWIPSPDLDPAFYLERHPDVARLCLSPLDHFIESGAAEGRCGASAIDRLAFPPVAGPRRPVLVILHEASRSGAPMLGLHIARRLGTSADMVAVMLRGGALEPHFAAACAAVVGPLSTGDDHDAEMQRLARQLVDHYDPLYAIANSAETAVIVPALGRLGVPIVALVHEFPAYLRPASKLRDVLDWAIHVVFPADIVAHAAFRAYPSASRRRGIHIMPQGRVELPPVADTPAIVGAADAIQPPPSTGDTVVLGLGTVHLRKGVDLFVAAAAILLRIAPERRFRFMWIGGGYDPANDAGYSAYLAAQIVQSGLEGRIELHDEVADLRPAYDAADLFFLSSRLDPQPNVAIEAALRGLPTICFAGASGTADILAADPATRSLVVPHLDAHAAAEEIRRLAGDPAALQQMRAAIARVGAAGYDMDAYIAAIDRWGRAAAAALHPDDLATLSEPGVVDAQLAVGPQMTGVLPPPARQVLQQWAVVGQSRDQHDNRHFRRPCEGFHPQAYAEAHPDCLQAGAHPLAHWVRNGRPAGPWSHRVFSSLDPAPTAATQPVALHAHLCTARTAADLHARLAANATRCDLFITTPDARETDHLRDRFAHHARSVSVIVVLPGHATLRAFTAVLQTQAAGYEIVGHIHDKPDDLRRHLQWESLVGDADPMLDRAAAILSAHPDVGLLMAETPILTGWDTHRPLAADLAQRLGSPLAPGDFPDFPLDGMIWARPAAVRPLLTLDLEWDMPSLQPTLERLLPHAARCAGYEMAALRAWGTTC